MRKSWEFGFTGVEVGVDKDEVVGGQVFGRIRDLRGERVLAGVRANSD